MNQKRCLTIQDYSCMGRCSLTVALPILSACGIETIGLPTAILSNHTAFSSWTYVDLTAEMEKSIDKWKDYDHHFDSFYTGYLGTDQIPVVIDIIKKLKTKDSFVMIDPAFGDGGKMYPGFDEKKHIEKMKGLLSLADITCPNLTEACLLADEEYKGEGPLDDAFLEGLARKIAALGPKQVLLTGTVFNDNRIGCICYDKEKDTFHRYETECYPGRYHGAGDSYCSAFVGCMLNGLSIDDCIKISHDFVHQSMKYDIDNHIDGLLYGLQFEKALPNLIKEIEDAKNK